MWQRRAHMICSTTNNFCFYCKQRAKFFDNSTGKWYCRISIDARGVCNKKGSELNTFIN